MRSSLEGSARGERRLIGLFLESKSLWKRDSQVEASGGVEWGKNAGSNDLVGCARKAGREFVEGDCGAAIVVVVPSFKVC